MCLLPPSYSSCLAAHVFYTLEVKPWDESNEYDDTQVAAKLAQAILTLGGLLTPWELANYFKTVDNSQVPFWYLKHKDLPWYKKPGIHMTKDRTFIIEGGPEPEQVLLDLHSNNSIARFGLKSEKASIGNIRLREIEFHPSHRYHYIDERIKVTFSRKGGSESTTTSTQSPASHFIET